MIFPVILIGIRNAFHFQKALTKYLLWLRTLYIFLYISLFNNKYDIFQKHVYRAHPPTARQLLAVRQRVRTYSQ